MTSGVGTKKGVFADLGSYQKPKAIEERKREVLVEKKEVETGSVCERMFATWY